MFNKYDVLETINMIEREHLDIRTITMGISLLPCIAGSADETAKKVYDRVCSQAENLVKVAESLSKEYGIPIVNKRVSVTPASIICAPFAAQSAKIGKALDKAAETLGIDFLGGYSALVHKGMADYERTFIETIPEVLATTNKLCSSINIGSSKSGINMDAVKLMGEVVKKTAALTADRDGFGCAKLVVFCNAVEDNPFMAGAFHGVGESGTVVNVGVSGPGVVQHAIESIPDADLTELAEMIKRTAFKITRAGQLVAREAARRLGAEFGIVDLSLAPTPARGDSVAQILEEMGLESVGTHGTTACLAMLNDAVKKGGVMASSRVGGLSGAFIPVSEDIGMIEAAERGGLCIDKLEAMTAVCSVGLDMIAIPGDTPASTISAIIADEAAIGMINNKTTAVRIIPAPGKGVGDCVNFGGLLGRAPIMPVHGESSEKFISRGGLIPAPIHSNKN
ncbi:MAG TPA: PFL family protein [Candidatus Coproplasma stercorigallinarum]|nr:PFL family protein [Candidatus Coproplasma stercorigallinarum]